MPYLPAFYKDLDSFRRELAEVRSVPEWASFKAHWFADMPWPQRSPEEIAAVSATPAPSANARSFHRTALADDLEPAARYEYFAAMQTAFAILFPAPADQPGAGGSAVRFFCPACELWSDDEGGPLCPECGRLLLKLRNAGPPRG